jgi:hypothetical protein
VIERNRDKNGERDVELMKHTNVYSASTLYLCYKTYYSYRVGNYVSDSQRDTKVLKKIPRNLVWVGKCKTTYSNW